VSVCVGVVIVYVCICVCFVCLLVRAPSFLCCVHILYIYIHVCANVEIYFVVLHTFF
jgi:hypothetical protein